MLKRKVDISKLRLFSQHIAQQLYANPVDLMRYLGAMQAQDVPMTRLALTIRTHDTSLQQIKKQINEGEIIRTHVMRPTWHFVAAEDVHWMLKLTAPHIKASLVSRHKQLELTADMLAKSHRIIENRLNDRDCLTRDDIGSELKREGFILKDNRLSHILMSAELEGIICSGPFYSNKPTYALLSNRVEYSKRPDLDESLALLAKRYFLSRMPATLRDFRWWSGLPAKWARQALDSIRNEFVSVEFGGEIYWFTHNIPGNTDHRDRVFLLPAYDEFLISYRDRTASMLMEHHKKAISQNGIFRPVIVAKGQILGTWKHTRNNGQLSIITDFFDSPGDFLKEQVNAKVDYLLNLQA